MGNLLELQMIYAGNNQLEGWIPISAFCNLRYLGELDLENNKISGALPPCLENVTSLRNIFLGSNNLSHGIPRLFWSLNDLLILNLSSNFLDGSIPFEIGNMKQLISLALTRNKFSGEIPSSIGTLVNLEILHFWENKFGGLIPESLGKITSMKDLDLSYNNLSGGIPKTLQMLQQLEFFNVSYHRLSGKVPHEGRFETFKNDSFLGNKDLWGDPLFRPCREVHHHRTRKKELFDIVLCSVAIASVLSILMISWYVKRIRVRKSTTRINDEIPKSYERVSYFNLQQVTNGFNENNFLGLGSSGSVYEGILADGTFCAIKVFNMEHEDALGVYINGSIHRKKAFGFYINLRNDLAQRRGNMKDVGATLKNIRLAFLTTT